MEIPHNTILSPTTEITVSSWIRTTTTGTREAFLSKSSGTSNTWLFEMNSNNCGVGKLGFFIVAGGTEYNVCSVSSLGTDTWYHVAATYDGTTVSIYLNGVLDASQSISGAIATNTLPIVVGNWNGGGRPWSGDIDDVRMYSRSLLAEEVESLAAVLPTKVTGLSGSGTFHEGFSLMWNANPLDENITNYSIEYSTDDGNSWVSVDPASTDTNYLLTGLLPGSYLFRVSAVNSLGQGTSSDEIEIDSPISTYTLGSSCAELEDIANDPGDPYGNYVMSEDIDCSDIPNFHPIDFVG